MYKKKNIILHGFLLVIALVILTLRTKIGLKDIEKKLFKDTVYIGISAEKIRQLNSDEIETLRKSIRNGNELTEILNANEVPIRDPKVGNIVFIFEWSDNYSGNLVYESNRNYMYIGKMQVHRDDNFMPEIYRFRPSSEI